MRQMGYQNILLNITFKERFNFLRLRIVYGQIPWSIFLSISSGNKHKPTICLMQQGTQSSFGKPGKSKSIQENIKPAPRQKKELETRQV